MSPIGGRPARSASAALLACGLACSIAVAGCGPAARREAFGQAMLFVRGRTVLYATTGEAAFTLTGDARPRAFAARDSGYYAWTHGDRTLRLFDAAGSERASWPLDGAYAWLSGSLALTRSSAFEDGRGFLFSLYKLDSRSGPKPVAAWRIDCFPADVVFAAGGRVYLAGADRADSAHAVYELGPGAGMRVALTFPRASDFARLVPGDGELFVFASGADKSARQPVLYRLPLGDSGAGEPEPCRLEGLPEDATCLYGSGFWYAGALRLPIAMAGGDVAIASIERRGGGFAVATVLAGSRGLYAPLGVDASDGAYRYVAYDYARDPAAAWLARYDGAAASFVPLP